MRPRGARQSDADVQAGGVESGRSRGGASGTASVPVGRGPDRRASVPGDLPPWSARHRRHTSPPDQVSRSPGAAPLSAPKGQGRPAHVRAGGRARPAGFHRYAARSRSGGEWLRARRDRARVRSMPRSRRRMVLALGAFAVVAGLPPAAAGAAPKISGVVWVDADRDGLRDQGELGRAGVRVTLQRAGRTVTSRRTGPTGRWSLSISSAGTYRVRVSVPPELAGFTLRDQGRSDARDSDVDTSGRSQPLRLTRASRRRTIDAGLLLPAAPVTGLSTPVLPAVSTPATPESTPTPTPLPTPTPTPTATPTPTPAQRSRSATASGATPMRTDAKNPESPGSPVSRSNCGTLNAPPG